MSNEFITTIIILCCTPAYCRQAIVLHYPGSRFLVLSNDLRLKKTCFVNVESSKVEILPQL